MDMSGGGGIHALCEDALAEILVHLDAVSVLRCRAVCKSWRRIATDRSFLATHAARRPREMIILTGYGFSRSAAPLSLDPDPAPAVGGDDAGRRRRLYLVDPCPRSKDGRTSMGSFDVLASLDGLLVLEERCGHYTICNPITRQWTNLPVLSQCSIIYTCGFYLHALSGEYRLLCHGAEGGGGGGEQEAGGESYYYYYYILSTGSTPPRRLARTPDKPERYDAPVPYRGALHWLSVHPQGARTGKMLAFDTVSETFRLMSRPPEPEPQKWMETMVHLLLLDGELSVATMQQLHLDIWVLQDYEAEKWALRHRHRVTLPPTTDFGLVGAAPMPARALSVGSSAVLIGSPLSTMAILYDLKENRLRRIIDFGGFISFETFSESLVPHDFFDLPRSPDVVPPKFSDPFDEHVANLRTR